MNLTFLLDPLMWDRCRDALVGLALLLGDPHSLSGPPFSAWALTERGASPPGTEAGGDASRRLAGLHPLPDPPSRSLQVLGRLWGTDTSVPGEQDLVKWAGCLVELQLVMVSLS